MTARPPPGATPPSPHLPRSADPERRAQLDALVLRDTALSEPERALFRELFPEIMDTHFERVFRVLVRRGVAEAALDDLVQDVFAAFYRSVCESGFPPAIRDKLDDLAAGMAANHLRGRRREPVSLGLPSSGAEKPRSGPDLLRAMDVEEFRRRLYPALTPEQAAVVDAVLVRELSHAEAAAELGIPRTTLSARLLAAKQVMAELGALFFSPSQRG